MTTKTQPRVRTGARVKAEASLLTGDPALVALAAAVDDALEAVQDPDLTYGELWLYGVVGGWWRGFNAESVANALRGLDVDVVYVRIHSPGGHAADGVAIANLLRNHRAKIIVVVDGLAASAASVIAIAGDEIVMCPGSQMMIHDASTGTWGNAAELRRAAEWIDGQSKNYSSVYAYKAGGTPEQWREVMTANDGWGTYYTAEEAVAAKLADSVGTRPAAGSPPVAPEDEIDEDDDEMVARIAHDLHILDSLVHPAARAAWSGQQLPKPPTASPRTGTPNPEGGTAVAFSDEQLTTMRTKLQLPDTADEAAIVAAVETVVQESLEERPPSGQVSVPPGMKLVSETVFEDVTAKAERGSQAAEQLLEMQCNAVLDKFKDRFPATPEAREKWANDYRRDPEATEKYLASSAVLVPTATKGHGGEGEDTTPPAVTEDPNYKKWSF